MPPAQSRRRCKTSTSRRVLPGLPMHKDMDKWKLLLPVGWKQLKSAKVKTGAKVKDMIGLQRLEIVKETTMVNKVKAGRGGGVRGCM